MASYHTQSFASMSKPINARANSTPVLEATGGGLPRRFAYLPVMPCQSSLVMGES